MTQPGTRDARRRFRNCPGHSGTVGSPTWGCHFFWSEMRRYWINSRPHISVLAHRILQKTLCLAVSKEKIRCWLDTIVSAIDSGTAEACSSKEKTLEPNSVYVPPGVDACPNEIEKIIYEILIFNRPITYIYVMHCSQVEKKSSF